MTKNNNSDDEILFSSDDDDTMEIDNNNNSSDGGGVEKYIIPYHYNHKSDMASFQFYSDEERCLYPVNGHFEIIVKPYGLEFNEERFLRMTDVIDNVIGSTFLTTNSEITPLFCNGVINNITFELPTTDLSVPTIITFLYYKCEAVLGNYGSIILFKFVPTYNNNSIYIDIPTHRRMNPYIIEEEWMEEKKLLLEEIENDPDMDIELDPEEEKTFLQPWWHRDDESTRDYFYGNDVSEPVYIIMELTSPVENEAAVYPLYTPESVQRAMDSYEQHKLGDTPIEGTNEDDIVDSNKNRITIVEMMDAIEQISVEYDEDSESDDDDSDDYDDDEIVIGTGKD